MIKINDKFYLTPKEASEFLSISKVTLWNWIKDDKIKKLSLSPKKIYISKEDLEAILK